jgi:ABC-type glycerol-3-phosphate transport system substrate-binding protein
MNTLRTRYFALGLSIAALAVAGCGSSSSTKSTPASGATSGLTPSTTGTTGTTTTAATSTSAFVAQVKPICKAFQAAGKTQGKTIAGAAAVIEQYVPKFRSVTPPAALQADYNQLLANFTKIADALKKNDLPAAQQLGPVDKKLAAKLGLSKCAS